MVNNNIKSDKLWEVAWACLRTVIDTVHEPFLILDKHLKVLSANKIFYAIFQTTYKETEGKKVYNLGNGQWNIPKLRVLLKNIKPKNTAFENFKVEHNFPKIGLKIMILNARKIYTENEKKPIILLALKDITKQVQLESRLKTYTKKLTLEVARRTAELKKRIKELQRLNKIMIGREIKMIELKAKLTKHKKIKI